MMSHDMAHILCHMTPMHEKDPLYMGKTFMIQYLLQSKFNFSNRIFKPSTGKPLPYIHLHIISSLTIVRQPLNI